ncbi:MAG: type II toxin-antitoxin system RelE/ParE family toxin [Coriobacteriales bacterium]|jgi:addiction module RelE/StbE family toxin|nr:type II toxin-antitoxin system RelE/ParE family toxin [Coriobacteriales bacterium]
MNDYRVVWTAPAEDDLTEIIEYIAQDSPAQAEKTLQKFKAEVDKLSGSPQRGRYLPELLKFDMRTHRELILAPWRVVYKIVDMTVFILVVIDGRRNISDLILGKLLRWRG